MWSDVLRKFGSGFIEKERYILKMRSHLQNNDHNDNTCKNDNENNFNKNRKKTIPTIWKNHRKSYKKQYKPNKIV